MPEIEAKLELSPEKIKPFAFKELDLVLTVNTKEEGKYWIECVFNVPAPLSLAPDKVLDTGKVLLGILDKNNSKEKKLKIFAANDVYPETYKIRATLFIYDSDGAISERQEYSKELECSEEDAKILQNL